MDEEQFAAEYDALVFPSIIPSLRYTVISVLVWALAYHYLYEFELLKILWGAPFTAGLMWLVWWFFRVMMVLNGTPVDED